MGRTKETQYVSRPRPYYRSAGESGMHIISGYEPPRLRALQQDASSVRTDTHSERLERCHKLGNIAGSQQQTAAMCPGVAVFGDGL